MAARNNKRKTQAAEGAEGGGLAWYAPALFVNTYFCFYGFRNGLFRWRTEAHTNMPTRAALLGFQGDCGTYE